MFTCIMYTYICMSWRRKNDQDQALERLAKSPWLVSGYGTVYFFCPKILGFLGTPSAGASSRKR